MAQRVKFTGGKELERALLELGEKEAAKVGRAAVRATAKPLLDAARGNVPVREGRLKRSLQLKVDRMFEGGQRKSGFTAIIKVSGRLGYRARRSDRQSRVRGKLGPARYNYQIGSSPNVYGAFVEFGIHGPPQPFMRPAWEAEGGQVAINRMGKEIWTGLDKFVSQVRKG